MKYSAVTSIVVSLMVTGTNWTIATYGKSTAALAVEASTNACVRVGRLISVQGEVLLKRKGWSDYHPTAVGAVLCLSDLLRPTKGARAVIQCFDPDQNSWILPNNMLSGVASGCRPPDEPIFTPTGPITPTRTETARQIPYIISPRSTLLLSHRPVLRWHSVPDATSYTVRVSGPGVNWETEVSTAEVVYPGEPPLQPVEEGYLLTVESDNGESPTKATFGLLDQNKVQRVRAAAERLVRQNLTNEAKTLALADLYIGQELIAESIDLLEALAAKGSKTAALYYTLGTLYAQVGLLDKSQENYLKAVELATTAKDIEGQAAAAAKLGEVYSLLGTDKASLWLKVAQDRYQTIRDFSVQGSPKQVRIEGK